MILKIKINVRNEVQQNTKNSQHMQRAKINDKQRALSEGIVHTTLFEQF